MSKLDTLIRLAGDPVLSQVCAEVVNPKGNEPWLLLLQRVAKKHKRCAGLAAPQLGIPLRAFVTTVSDGSSLALRTFINPTVLYRSNDSDVMVEECLSYPGRRKAIRRASVIKLSFDDGKGHRVTKTFSGFIARVIQHELDHLDGICRVGDESPADDYLN